MAYDDEKQRLLENSTWYNEFLDGLHQILAKTATALVDEYDRKKRIFYYPKANDKPKLPSYYMIGLGGVSAVQVYFVLDPQLVEDQPAFLAEPSFIVVKHTRGERYGYVLDYGIRILSNNGVACATSNVGGKAILTGELLAGEGKGAKFHAFQVLLDPFIAQQDLNKVIEDQIVGVLKSLPAF
jgi:hypothetical protein